MSISRSTTTKNDNKVTRCSSAHNSYETNSPTNHNVTGLHNKEKVFETMYLSTLQIGEKVELYRIFRNDRVCVTKRSKIGDNGFVCPRFLREINNINRLSNPPQYLEYHPGRHNIIKLLDVYVEDGYLHYDMEPADGTLCELKLKINPYMFKEQILIDISNGLQYMHEMGFNHFDLSHSNIAYFDLTVNATNQLTELNSKMFRFVLMDFGNVVHRDRPMTLEVSTYYTMPVEMINAVKILNDLENVLKTYSRFIQPRTDFLPKLSDDVSTYIDNKIKMLRKCIIHRKSDIWSLGSLSYYLHSFDYYADGDTLEQQRDMITTKTKEDIDGLVGHQEIISKTRVMLISDHTVRPVIYFSRIHKSTDPREQKNISVADKDPIEHPHHRSSSMCNIDFPLYKSVIDEIINNVAIKNKKIFMINVLDDSSKNHITTQCYDLESNIMRIVIQKIRKNISIGTIKSSVINAVCVARIILLWLVSHLHVNLVWSMGEVSLYLTKIYTVANINSNEIKNLITNIATIILETVGWNLEKYQK